MKKIVKRSSVSSNFERKYPVRELSDPDLTINTFKSFGPYNDEKEIGKDIFKKRNSFLL